MLPEVWVSLFRKKKVDICDFLIVFLYFYNNGHFETMMDFGIRTDKIIFDRENNY